MRYGTGAPSVSARIQPKPRHHLPSVEPSGKVSSIGIPSRAVAPGDGVTFSVYFNTREGELPGAVSYPIEIIADSTASEPAVADVWNSGANVVPDAIGRARPT